VLISVPTMLLYKRISKVLAQAGTGTVRRTASETE